MAHRLFGFAFFLLIHGVATGQEAAPAPLKVLFIGNSYTGVNDLPAMVVGLAGAAGGRKLEADRHLVGGCTFERHVKETGAIDTIREQKWDAVILQEQSLRPVIDRNLMSEYARILHAEIEKQGAETIFYLAWARQHIPDMQEGADPATSPGYARAMYRISRAAKATDFESWCEQHKAGLEGGLNGAYFDIAEQLGAGVAPVGVAWKKALAADPPFVLHLPDKSHPNPTGSYLAACVFYAALLDENPVGLPGEIKKGDKVLVSIPVNEAKRLQEIAWEAVKEIDGKKPNDGATYTNPVGDTPLHMGDPFVIQHEGSYYLFGTNAPNEGFKCWVSTDLVHWQPKGWACQESPETWAKSHYWAPEVEFYRGKFYMTYSAMNKASDPPRLLIALAVSDKPEGPYQDLHAPWFDFGYSAIDGHIFLDDDGKPYLYFSRNGFRDGYSFGIMYGVALADDLSKPVGEPVKLMEADQPWEKVRYAENRCNEGAFVLKHEGRYYMTYSANHTGFPHYGIGYATADKPLGPWVKAEENPVAATDPAVGISGPGHSCITSSPDGKEMFIVYHTHADAEKPSGDRVVNIDRMGFDEFGKLKITGPTRSPQPMPSGCR